MFLCNNTAVNMLVISSNFKINSAYCVTKFITRNYIFWNKNIVIVINYFQLLFFFSNGSWNVFILTLFGQIFWEDIPSVEVLVFLFLPNITCTLFSKFGYPRFKVGWVGFLLLAPHPQNEMNTSLILVLVSITLVERSCSDQMRLC